MDTTDLDSLTDKLCKTDSTSFPVADKLMYYNIGYGILSGLLIDEQEDTYEEEYTKDTVSGQRDYLHKARIHHINWLKIDYGDGFVPARYKSEQELISEYGDVLEDTLTAWPKHDPIYFYKGKHFFVTPAPAASEAGTDRLKASIETLPADLEASDTPDLPENTHHGLSAYAAMQFLDEDDPLWKKAKRMWDEVLVIISTTTFPRARQAHLEVSVPQDEGYDY